VGVPVQDELDQLHPRRALQLLELVGVEHGVAVPEHRSVLVSYLQPRPSHSLCTPSEELQE
jgi:hypothetical protein